jgi:hypothetical protein
MFLAEWMFKLGQLSREYPLQAMVANKVVDRQMGET